MAPLEGVGVLTRLGSLMGWFCGRIWDSSLHFIRCVAYVAAMGNQWTTFFFIVSSLTPYAVKLLQWDPVDNPRSVSSFFFIWKASFNHLEYGPGIFNVVSLAGT